MAHPLKEIDRIKFGILSPDEIRKISVTRIITADTYDEDGLPIDSGLMDGRLGTIEPGQRCKTCGNRVGECPGHFGHIELARPVIHVGFAPKIQKILRAICRKCSKLIISDEKLEELHESEGSGISRVADKDIVSDTLKKAAKLTECPYCDEKQVKIKLEKPTTFYEKTDAGTNRLNPTEIRDRFERMTEEDCLRLGINPAVARPEWMILTVLPIPPVCVRPSITLDSGVRSEDDMTHKLVDIIRINQRLRENIEAGAPQLIVEDLWELLQYHVTTYFNNEVSGIPPARHRSGRALRTLAQRLKGKEGRFRSNLSGKRVDFSARTVISPDPNLSINEVGVPYDIAKILTIPERITEWNIDEMRTLIINGPETHPGANYVIRLDGRRIDLRFVKNREAVADTLESGFIIERHLKDRDIVLFNRQPSLHRLSIMAHEVVVMPYKTFRLSLCVCPPYNADFDGDEMNLHVPQCEEAQAEARILMRVQEQILTPRYGGPIIGGIQDYISAAFILTRKSSLYTRDEVGNLLMAAGYLDDDSQERYEIPTPALQYPKELWTGKQIISVLLPKGVNLSLKAKICQRCDECKKEECPFDAYVLIRNGRLLTGIIDKKAIGAGQPESVLHRIVKDYSTKKGRQFLDSVARMLIEVITNVGFTIGLDDVEIQEEADARIEYILNNAGEMVNKLIEVYKRGELQRLPGRTLLETLEMKIMGVLSEARDEAGRIAGEYLGIDKHIVIMTKTGARGNPLNLAQMAACVGQQSVRGERIIRGYRQRTLPHFQKGDLSAPARGFVNSSYYKGLIPIEFFFHAMGGREGLVDTAVRTSTSGYMQRRLINALQDIKVEYDSTVRNAVGNIIQFKYGEDRIDPAKSDHGKAVNIDVIIEKVISEIEYKGPSINSEEKEFKNQIEELLKTDQLPRSIIEKLSLKLKSIELDKGQFDALIIEALKSYHKALIEPGEAVGIVAAQSIGEPGTQMTLKTFHYAGAAEFNVTLGLPRLIEIVDARRNPSTPTMTVFLEKDTTDETEMEGIAREIARLLELTKVENIAKSVEIDLATMYLVITVDQDLMKDKKIDLDLIKKRIETQLKAFKKEDIKGSKDTITLDPKTDDLDKLQKLLEKVRELAIKGLKGINRVIIRQDEDSNEFVIHTDGTNFKGALLIPGVDSKRTITNHIREVESTLGIEACRTSIINESTNVLEEQGLDVDIRHIMLVADLMTNTGAIRQIGRHGISGKKSSVLARAAFEVTIKHLLEAAIRGDEDPLKGITENVIIGQVIPLGTGGIDLLIKPSRKSPS
ncbi:MAG: DNA-directed RNA polymerase subunit A' [Candidatus Helarchaeota archaeon]|nr:DNA-directed RNA polymerase subunit A' [Candidatus Helarchaeota archaeon]